MAFKAVEVTQFPAVGGTNYAANKPASVSEGDRLFAFCTWDGGNTVTPPSGWTEIANLDNNVDGQQARLYAKDALAGPSEPSTYTWTNNGQPDGIISIYAFSGRSNASATVGTNRQESGGTAVGSPSTITFNGVTAASGDDLLLVCDLDKVTPGTDVWDYSSWSNSAVERVDSNRAWTTQGGATIDGVSGGATGDMTATITRSSGSANTGWSTIMVAIPVTTDTVPRPNSDVQTTGWSSTGANFYGAIDEASIDDADYVTSPSITGAGVALICGLSNGPLAAGSYSPVVKASVSTGTATLRIKLLNDSNASQGQVDIAVTSTPTRYDPTITTSGSATRISYEFFT